MPIIWRVFGTMIFGSAFYAALLFTVFRFALPLVVTKVLVWNIIAFNFLGRGSPVGYLSNGDPIYDGDSTYGGFSLASILTGFIIYPVLIFLVLMIVRKFRSKQA